MMRRAGVRCAVALAMVGLATAGVATQPAAAGDRRATAGSGYVPGSEVPQGGPIHGMILVSSNRPLDTVVHDIPRLAADGINLISIYVTNYIDTATSTNIHSGTYTPSDAELEAAISLAHDNGVAVELVPTIWTVRPFVWRGAFQPDNVKTFFRNYRTMMNHYAELAADNGVELLSIGSEYSSLDGHAGQWVRIARQVRDRYAGLITYMAVTQHITTITWWRAVDYIGVSPYYPLSYAPRPTREEMMATWNDRWFPFVEHVSKKYDRPVLFNEIGYLSAQGAAAAPWQSKTKEPASEQVQADAYAALLDGADSQPWLRGVVFFRWSEPTAAPVDKTYSPRDKLAECVIAEHWAASDAPVGVDGRPVMCLGGSVAENTGLGG